jgi:hypothetical protein
VALISDTDSTDEALASFHDANSYFEDEGDDDDEDGEDEVSE